MIDKLICSYNKTLLDALRIIDNNGKGICFVVDKFNVLKGMLTDGDIRRALLNETSLDERVGNITSQDFIYGNIDENYNELVSKTSNKVSVIPIVDNKFKVVNFFEYKQKINLPVAIPNLNGNEFKYLTDALLSTWISSSGIYINKFEDNFSDYSDCAYGVSVSNGTAALHLALVALKIGFGDEVIVPDLTFAATINAVLHANATPIIVDVEESSWCINPEEIEKAITSKTKAIIAVHLFGQPCNMDEILRIAKENNLKVIEDCAEAHGAMFKNQKVGSIGDIGCFSFYGNKVITTGEGGMCTTNSPDLNNKMRILRDHGMSREKKYWHEVVGFNYRMTNLQAAIGVAQLERIDKIHQNRRIYEDNYKNFLNQSDFRFQKTFDGRKKITWLVSVVLDKKINRDNYLKKLNDIGIDARPFFYPLSAMDIYQHYCKSDTPVCKMLSEQGISLPTYENLKSLEELETLFKSL